MRNSLISFKAEIDRLVRFLDASDAKEELVAAMLSGAGAGGKDLAGTLEVIRKNSTIIRRQNYVSSIIVLYGALERYVEETVEEYIDELVSMHSEFRELPQGLRDRHTRLTIDYLALLKDGKVRETEEISSVVAALHDCLSGSDRYRLNARAFLVRSSNMNLKRIRQIMGGLGLRIPARRVLSAPAYDAFLIGAGGPLAKDMNDSEVEAALDHVDELVRLRNDIAHGVVNLVSLEDNTIVRERAAKLGAFAEAMSEILVGELLQARISHGQLTPVEGEVQVFGHNIACFAWPKGRLVPGDVLVMRPAGGAAELRHGVIASIEIDRVDQVEVMGREGLLIGVKVPFRVKANGTFFVWHVSEVNDLAEK